MMAGAAIAAARQARAAADDGTMDDSLHDWDAVRDQFEMSRDDIHMSNFFLAPHPKPVREAIARHRRGFDRGAIGYFFENVGPAWGEVLLTASEYLGVTPTDIAFTDSTTMGLGLLYGALTLREGQEVLTTVHDHYSTDMSLRHRADRTGATVRKVTLYRDGARANEPEMVQAIVRAVSPRTRVVAVTWVHSCSGVKIPVRAIADALGEINRHRDEQDRALLCVDGVHGLAIDDVTLPELGCDFFIAGTHKWLHGPRGTGIVWGTPDAWLAANPVIPAFSWDTIGQWMGRQPSTTVPPGTLMTPGGFHSFEHRWAVSEAFKFHRRIGKDRVDARTHELNRQLKEGLATMSHVTLRTPMSDNLSAGIVCFEVDGLEPHEVVDRLLERRIIASTSPYATTYVRLAPSITSSPQEVDACLAAVHDLG